MFSGIIIHGGPVLFFSLGLSVSPLFYDVTSFITTFLSWIMFATFAYLFLSHFLSLSCPPLLLFPYPACFQLS